MQLENLNLADTLVRAPPLHSLAGLKDLNLDRTKFDDAGMAALAGLTGLNRLNLRDTKVTDAGLQHLARLGELRELDLFGAK